MKMGIYNSDCITGVCGTIDSLLGIPGHEGAAAPLPEITGRCDRVFMYHPDAVAAWIYEKYRGLFAPLEERVNMNLPMLSVVPPVTPVCFASMYTGMQPEQHGIRKYVKPVLRVPTVFDDAVRAGKKAAVVSTEGDSISLIFLERDIDYFIYRTKEECCRKALELIREDRHDLIVLYNGDYDYWMHRTSPDGRRALKSLKENIETFCTVCDTAKEAWKGHASAVAFAPDHGCHEIAGGLLGQHGIKAPCDMNIFHFWRLNLNGMD
jgi:predicted AlkP superfamily pyrophosphatase or phosphodiesterase